MRGWQARYVGELDWSADGAPPKYYTCPGMPRRKLVYNLPNASQFRTGVIVEGPTDVWSFGPMAVCTLGDTMTPAQRRAFISVFKRGSAILLYDPEAYVGENEEKTKKLIRSLEGQFDGGFCPVILPPGRDPGNTDRDFLREYVQDEARSMGVKVSWNQR
jgi:hypothetical protein